MGTNNWYEPLNNELEGPETFCHVITGVHLDKSAPSRWPKSKPSKRVCVLASCPTPKTEVVKCKLLCVLISQLCWINSEPALGRRQWLHKDSWLLFKICVVVCVRMGDAFESERGSEWARVCMRETERHRNVKERTLLLKIKRRQRCWKPVMVSLTWPVAP